MPSCRARVRVLRAATSTGVVICLSALAASILIISSCGTLGTGVPAPDDKSEDIVPEIALRPDVPAVVTVETPDEIQDRLILENSRGYIHEIVQHILPRIEHEVFLLLAEGRARRIDTNDFYHLHIGYRREFSPSGIEELTRDESYQLLYHTLERPHLLRKDWIEELAGLPSQRVRSWIGQLRRHEFDYRDFFFGSGQFTRPEPLDPETLWEFAEQWRLDRIRTRRRIQYLPDLEEFRNRLIYVSGSVQPEYSLAVNRLFNNKNIISEFTEQGVHIRSFPQRNHPNYRYPVTVYFEHVAGWEALEDLLEDPVIRQMASEYTLFTDGMFGSLETGRFPAGGSPAERSQQGISWANPGTSPVDVVSARGIARTVSGYAPESSVFRLQTVLENAHAVVIGSRLVFVIHLESLGPPLRLREFAPPDREYPAPRSDSLPPPMPTPLDRVPG